MDGRQEVALGPFVPDGNRPELLELAEEVLNQVACLQEALVVGTLVSTIASGRDDHLWGAKTVIMVEPRIGSALSGPAHE
jgi:hypothetical protein